MRAGPPPCSRFWQWSHWPSRSLSNALWLTQYGPVKRTFAEASKSSAVMATRYTPATLPELGKSSLSMLPPTVISYETITRQTVPGTDNTQSEGIYVSLNVDLQMQREIQSYARAEGYADENAAAARLAELAAPLPGRRQAGLRRGFPERIHGLHQGPG